MIVTFAKRATALWIGCAMGLSGCSEAERLLNPDSRGPLLERERIGIHMSPTEVSPEEVVEAAGVASRIRMQAPLDAIPLVEERVAAAPPEARFLIILTSDPRPAYEFMEAHRFDPKVEAYQLENEPENFLAWDPATYIDWVDSVLPEVEARLGPQQRLVSAATRPMVQGFPTNLEWNEQAINLGILDRVDVFAIHVYDEQFEKLPAVHNRVIERVENAGVPIWVTETGTRDFNDQLDYFRIAPAAYADFSIRPEHWTIYAWRDDTLGFSLRAPDGSNSPLLQALIDREAGT